MTEVSYLGSKVLFNKFFPEDAFTWTETQDTEWFRGTSKCLCSANGYDEFNDFLEHRLMDVSDPQNIVELDSILDYEGPVGTSWDSIVLFQWGNDLLFVQTFPTEGEPSGPDAFVDIRLSILSLDGDSLVQGGFAVIAFLDGPPTGKTQNPEIDFDESSPDLGYLFMHDAATRWVSIRLERSGTTITNSAVHDINSAVRSGTNAGEEAFFVGGMSHIAGSKYLVGMNYTNATSSPIGPNDYRPKIAIVDLETGQVDDAVDLVDEATTGEFYYSWRNSWWVRSTQSVAPLGGNLYAVPYWILPSSGPSTEHIAIVRSDGSSLSIVSNDEIAPIVDRPWYWWYQGNGLLRFPSGHALLQPAHHYSVIDPLGSASDYQLMPWSGTIEGSVGTWYPDRTHWSSKNHDGRFCGLIYDEGVFAPTRLAVYELDLPPDDMTGRLVGRHHIFEP